MLDYNLYYRKGEGNIISWDGVKDWNTYHIIEGNEPQSLNLNPHFVGTKDLSLATGSPCRDSGINIGAMYEDGLAPNAQWTTSVRTLNQNAHGSGWERGTYVYP